MELSTFLPPAPPHQTHSVTVVVAARNEEGNLKRLLLALEETFRDLDFTLPVLLIDDGSTDGSCEVLIALKEQYPFLRIITHPYSQSLTGALKTAIANTSSDWLYLSPADLESDPRTDLPLLLKACVSGVDGVAGWRQGRKDGKILASVVANSICRWAFGLKIHDLNWIKLVRRDLLVALPLERVTHAYLLPVLASLGYNIIEVPTPWHPRQAGKSKFNAKRLLPSALQFLQLWWWFQIKACKFVPRKF